MFTSNTSSLFGNRQQNTGGGGLFGGGGGGNTGGMGGGGGGGLFGSSGGGNTGGGGGGLFGGNTQQRQGGGLFGGGGGMGNSQNQSGGGGLFGGGGGMGNNQNQGGGGLFGGGGSSGGMGMGGGMGTQNRGGLFGSTGGGGMGSNQGGGGLFGGGNQNQNQGGGGLFGGGGSQNQGGGMLGMLGGGSQSKGSFSHSYNINQLPKNKENITLVSITNLPNFKGKTLDEIRTEDYFAGKNNQIPDNIKSQLQAQWQRNQQGGGMSGFGNQSGGMGSMGGGGGGGLFGGGGNQNQMGGGGGGLFGGGGNQNQGGGGLFGNKQQGSGGGGLFGGGGNQNQMGGGGGGLFGGGGNQNQGGGGLFGGGNQNQGGGGLFGNKQQGSGGGGLFGGGGNQQQGGGGGLFGGGGNQQGGGGGGLFGGGGNQQQGSGGLFGNNQNKQGGGLFGGGGNTGGGTGGGGLFGGGGNQQGGGGGLFGNQNKPAGSGGGGLFGGGGSTGGTGGGGLFGGGGNAGGGGGGLFGNQNKPAGSGGGGLFGGGGSAGGAGGGGLFGGSSGGGGGLFSGQNKTGGTGGGLFGGGSGTGTGGGGLFGGAGGAGGAAGGNQAPQEIQQLLAQAGVDMQQYQLYEQLNKLRPTAQTNYSLFGKTVSGQNSADLVTKYETGRDSLLSSIVKRNPRIDYNPFDRGYTPRKDYAELSSDLEARASRNKAMLSKRKEEPVSLLGRKPRVEHWDQDIPLPPGQREVNKKMMISSYIEDRKSEKKIQDISRVQDEVRLMVYFSQGEEERAFSVEAKTSSTCLNIKTYILNQIYETNFLNFSKYKLLYKNKILSDNQCVGDIGFKDNDKVYLILDPEASEETPDEINGYIGGKDQFASEDLLPKLTKNYHTEPSIVKLNRMSESELRNIQNFSIYNEYVKLTFEGKTDLTGLDLDEIVVLGHRSVEVYPENCSVPLPEPGRGLNKAATIEFYQWTLPKKYLNNVEAYRAKMEDWANSQNAQFLYYDPDREVLCIRVKDFNLKP